MKSAEPCEIVLVTAPNRKIARQLARQALAARLAACASLVPGLESHYWWKGKVEFSRELLIIFKTTRRCRRKLEALILDAHPYETPEFVTILLNGGNARYLAWLREAVW